MKRSLFTAIFIYILILSSAFTAAAVPQSQESTSPDDEGGLVIVYQNAENVLPPISGPASGFSNASQFDKAPDDPEWAASPFGIEINDFYNSLREDIKNSGRHSVSFEEKGRKNASKVSIDGDVELYLYYTKENANSVLEHISFESELTEERLFGNARNLFLHTVSTICSLFGDSYDSDSVGRIFELMAEQYSLVYEDMLFYGSIKEKNGTNILTVRIYHTGSGYVKPDETSYSQSAEDEFRTLINEFKADGIIPYADGTFYFHEDYEKEWAQINWYQWDTFTQAQNFVISVDITWKSAFNTPNYSNAGCGFVYRAKDTRNHLFASLNMDGKVHFGGIKDGKTLNYDDYSYGTFSTKGSAQLILVVSGDRMTAYVNGSPIGSQKNLAFDDNGSLAFTVWSGTNKDYGTRCTFENIYYYIW